VYYSVVPADEDTPFVIGHIIVPDSPKVEEQDLKIVLSSQRLLNFMPCSDFVQADATYKLTWQGYLIVIMGCRDKNNTFHPFCFAVCKGETSEDYAFVFDSTRKQNPDWSPSILMADGSEAITAGFERVSGAPCVHLQCFFHVRKNIEKYLKMLTKGGVSGQILADLNCSQTCLTESTFHLAARLFVEKWQVKKGRCIKKFVKYFHDQWLTNNASWYEGAILGYPSTNNGLEATNVVLKRNCTVRERLPVGQFLVRAEEVVRRWSEERDTSSINCKIFARSGVVRMWTKAYHWALQKKVVIEWKQKHSTMYYTAAACSDPITSDRFATIKAKENKWRTFGEFKKECHGVWVITIISRSLDESTCACPYFEK